MTQFQLSKRARSEHYQLSGFDRIDSTNAEALRLAESGKQSAVWIAALEQTAGRGRRGRAWQSQPGNLAASLLLRLDASAEDLGILGFVAGLSMLRALKSVAPAHAGKIKLKWPNDILFDGAKLVGILLEAHNSSPNENHIVIGMGVNVASVPEDLPYKAIALSQIDPTITPQSLFTALTESWVQMFALWNGGQGTAEVLELWRESAFGQGGPIRVRNEKDEFSGIFERLDNDGRLVVRLPDQSFKVVAAGDIYF